jgi:anti-sigma factor (TIGR02949 family)
MAAPDRHTCEDAFRRLDDYLDRELSPRELPLVEAHLRECAVCASEYAFEASVIRHVRAKLDRLTAPADLLSRISASLSAARAESDADQDE